MPESPVTIRFADGEECKTWTSLTVRESFTDPLGDYQLTIEPPPQLATDHRWRLRRGELFAIQVNGNPLATPIVVNTVATAGRDGIKVEVHGKSVLHTPYQGGVDPELARRWKEDVAVDKIILDVLAPYGFSELRSDSAANVNAMTGIPIGSRKAAKDIKQLKLNELQAQEGESAYGICSRVFNRLGVVLRVDWEGRLLLTAPDYDQEVAYTIAQDAMGEVQGDYVVGTMTVNDGNEELYSQCTVLGQAPDKDGSTQCTQPHACCGVEGIALPPNPPLSKVPRFTIPAGNGAYRSTSAYWKPKFVRDKQARDAKRAQNAARLAMGSRAAQAWWVDCTVRGLVAKTGRVWTPDTIARVYSDKLGIDEELWVMDRSFNVTAEGASTTLKLIAKHSLVLDKDGSILTTFGQFRATFAYAYPMTGAPALTFNAAAHAVARGAGNWDTTDGYAAGMRARIVGSTSNDALWLIDSIAGNILTLDDPMNAVVNEGPTAGCVVVAQWYDKDGLPTWPVAELESGGFSGGFTGIPKPFVGAQFTVTCNAGAADAVLGVDEYDWYLSQSTDQPADQYLAISQTPDAGGNSYSGSVVIRINAALWTGVPPLPVIAEELVIGFTNAHLYCQRKSDKAIQWVDLLAEQTARL